MLSVPARAGHNSWRDEQCTCIGQSREIVPNHRDFLVYFSPRRRLATSIECYIAQM